MKLRNALKLHNEDEVTIKKTGEIMQIVETEVIPKMNTEKFTPRYVNIMLNDGNWYNHKEVR